MYYNYLIQLTDINACDLAIKLKNQDVMRETGVKLREVLIDVDFGLQDTEYL